MTRKLIVLGIDGMDPRTTKRLLDEGRLPNIKKYLVRGSARENLDMLGALPTITPPCWTTLATGAYPGTHGITCYWRQSPESLDAVVYNMDSRLCRAEQIWNVTAEAGIKSLVWHWPGSSWPPSSESELLHVVDGTQPGSVNMGIAQMDWEKVIIASSDCEKLRYIPRAERPAGVGCIIDDVEALIPGSSDDEMMELWWGDEPRKGNEIRTYVHGLEDSEIMIGAKVGYDVVTSPIRQAKGWSIELDDSALEFTLLLSGGTQRRTGLILRDETGRYSTVSIFRNKKAPEPLVTLHAGEMVSTIDEAAKKEITKPCRRSYKLIELAHDGSRLRLWVSNALDITNNTLWHPHELLDQLRDAAGAPPAVSLIGGEDADLVREVFLPSWSAYNHWQAQSINYLIRQNHYEAVFTHLHNVDCAGHQFWHLAHTLPEWDFTDERVYQSFIEQVYIQTDEYLGEFLYLLDEGWSVLIVSDHGLVTGENIPPDIGEYGGLNLGVMSELGYTVMKRKAEAEAAGDTPGNEGDSVSAHILPSDGQQGNEPSNTPCDESDSASGHALQPNEQGNTSHDKVGNVSTHTSQTGGQGNLTNEASNITTQEDTTQHGNPPHNEEGNVSAHTLQNNKPGSEIDAVDWSKTRAVQIRSNYIYINLKGRDKYGIVDPKDKYSLEEQIISDLYNYRDPRTGRRVIGLAMRNKDSIALGLGGSECGDIFFTINEGYNRLHGDGLSTSQGYFGTSVSPVFIASGQGIRQGFTTKRLIRQVDVAPTISSLLKVRVPRDCEGAPIYQILED